MLPDVTKLKKITNNNNNKIECKGVLGYAGSYTRTHSGMSLIHTNISSVIISQDPVSPPHLHFLISLERASFFNQNLGLNGWPWAQ